MKRRAFVALMATTMMASMLTGCGFEFSVGGFGTPKSATAVVERYMEKTEEANYNMSGNLNMEFGMNAEGMSVSIPMRIGIDVDMLGAQAHGTMDISASFLGESMNDSAEMYIADGKTYVEDDGSWYVQESGSFTDLAAALDAGDFEDATLVVDKKAKTYTISQDLATFMANADLEDSMSGLTDDMASMFDISSDEVLSDLGDAMVVYVFDTDYRLLSVSLDEISYEKEVEDDSMSGTAYVNFDFNFEFGKFGEIKDSDVKMPESVKSSALEEASSDVFNDFETDVDGTVSGETFDDTTVSEPTENIDQEFSVTPVGTDVFGSYKGVSIDTDATDWASTFGADGWEFDNEDGEYSFMSCVNSKYDGVDLYVYNKSHSNTTSSDILNDGYYGYNINVSLASGKKPVMSFNGLTWGASADELLQAYGEPTYTYKGSMYTSYEFAISDTVNMEFYIYDNGLQEVELSVYSY